MITCIISLCVVTGAVYIGTKLDTPAPVWTSTSPITGAESSKWCNHVNIIAYILDVAFA